MELIKVINARKTIESIADRDDISAHLAYWLTKFVVKSDHEDKFYTEELRKLAAKYADVQQDGSIHVKDEFKQQFEEELTKLNSTDVADPGIRFKLTELNKELKLSVKQMYTFIDFVEEDE